MGDTVLFRAQPGTRASLATSRQSKRCCYYSVSSAEILSLVVVKKGTEQTRAWARALLEGDCLPHTRIEWDGDVPNVHTVKGVEYR